MENKHLNAIVSGAKLGLTWREQFKALGWWILSIALALFLGFDIDFRVLFLIFFVALLHGIIEKVWPEERGS